MESWFSVEAIRQAWGADSLETNNVTDRYNHDKDEVVAWKYGFQRWLSETTAHCEEQP